MKEIKELQAAKKALKTKYGQRPWFRGVGITSEGLGLYAAPNFDYEDNEIPTSFEGHPVKTVFIDRFEKR